MGTKVNKRKNGRQKGACGEREAAKFLSKYNLPNGTPVVAKRMARNGQKGQADLEHNIPDLHIEVKRNEKIDVGTAMLSKAMQQAWDDSEAAHGQEPVVMWRRNGGGWRISAYHVGQVCTIEATYEAHEYLVGEHDLYLRDAT